jgi:hypothetical protein
VRWLFLFQPKLPFALTSSRGECFPATWQIKEIATNGASFWLRRVSTKLPTLFAMAWLLHVVQEEFFCNSKHWAVGQELWLWHLYCAAATEELMIEVPNDEAIVLHGSLCNIRGCGPSRLKR